MKQVRGLKRKQKQNKNTKRDNTKVTARGKVGWGKVKEHNGGSIVMEGDLTWRGEDTIPYTDDVLQNCTP